MAIPGLKATLEVRGKVRIGEKRTSAKGSSFPAATDYFLSDDPEFAQLCGDKPKSIRVQLPHAAADENFSTGMEWWRGKQLSCYSKGEGNPTIAYRVIAVLDADDEKRGAPMGRGNERQPITCRFRDCPHFGRNADNKECRVMGRLVFFLDGGRTDSVLEIDTKSWNTIEQLQGALAGLSRTAPLNAPGRVYELSVEMRQKGRDKFPVLNISEADVLLDTDQKISEADAMHEALRRRDADAPSRETLAYLLDVVRPGWRDKPEFIERIKEVGPEAALETMLADWQARA